MSVSHSSIKYEWNVTNKLPLPLPRTYSIFVTAVRDAWPPQELTK